MKIMIDSGAFSVWKSGIKICLDSYISFCKKFDSKTDYFVNLDVIPYKGELEKSCLEGMNNYKKMIGQLPIEKTIPVVHLGEDVKWLERYLKLGASYVGIGFSAGRKSSNVTTWVSDIKSILGKTKIHGFAVASPSFMGLLKWHSVDSTTWVRHSQVWQILIPKTVGGIPNYKKEPFVVKLSPRASKHPSYIHCLSPTVKNMVNDHLKINKVDLGEFDILESSTKEKKDHWLTPKKNKIIRVKSLGVQTDMNARNVVNSNFYLESAKAFGIPNFYFSGMNDPLLKVDCMLLSFAQKKEVEKWLQK